MGFSNRADREFQLDVRVGKATNVVRYAVRTNGTVDFEFVDARGNVRRESHVLGARKGGGNGDACGRRRRGGARGGHARKGGPAMSVRVACAMMGLAVAWKAVARPALSFVVLVGEGQGWSSLSVPMDEADPRSASPEVRTPNLDRLAREGMRFGRFLAASPRCTPSRAAILTGRSPAQLRMTFVSEGRGDDGGAATRLAPATASKELASETTTLAEVLRGKGYATARFGKWHLGRTDPSRHGFDASSGATSNGGPDNSEHPNPKQAFASADAAVAFIRRAVGEGRPFYVHLCQYAGKSVLDARPETYAAAEERLGARGRARAGAVAVAEDADAAQGRVLAVLDELGVAGGTYVFYTTDHGAPGRNPPLAGGRARSGRAGFGCRCWCGGRGFRPGRAAA